LKAEGVARAQSGHNPSAYELMKLNGELDD
jgi:hypothetical protein